MHSVVAQLAYELSATLLYRIVAGEACSGLNECSTPLGITEPNRRVGAGGRLNENRGDGPDARRAALVSLPALVIARR